MNSNINFTSHEVDSLLHAKIKHGQLFLFKLPKGYAVFRPLTVSESEALLGLAKYITEISIEDWVLKNTWVAGNLTATYFLVDAPYLIPKNVAHKIIILSNIQEEKDYVKQLEVQRSKAGTLQSTVEILIAGAFKGLDPSKIKDMTQLSQLTLAALAEKVSGQNITIGGRAQRNTALKKFRPDATVIGGEAPIDISSKEVADTPDFNEQF